MKTDSIIIQLEVDLMVKYLNKIGHNTNEDNQQTMAENRNEELIEACFYFPIYFYSSFLISCYSFIEQRMIQMCLDFELKSEVNINGCDSFGKGIERVKTFLHYHPIGNRKLANFN